MSTLYNATQNMGFTENGALTYTTTGSAVLDLFSMGGALRSSEEERIRMLVDLAYREDPVKTMAVLLYLRDCRGGQGEKRVFKVAIKRLIEAHNLNKKSLYEAISKYGCYKDVFDIFTPEEIAPVIAPIIEEHKTLSKGTLLEKWMPSVKGARSGYAHKLAKLLGMTDKEYRKYLSSKRAALNLVESKMCKNEWDKIDYPSVPSRANLIYSDAFNRHDAERYSAFLNKVEKGEEKINTSVLYPYEVFNKINTPNADVLWDNLKDYTNGENALVVCDTSGSMCCSYSGVLPISVSVSLALYFAERNKGIFHNEFITFSENPCFQKIEGTTLKEKFHNIEKANWGMSTNLQKVFDLVLNSAVKNKVPEEEMPTTIYIISDMEFNYCVDGTNLDGIIKKYNDAGYKLPRLVFWNVNSKQNNVCASKDTSGVMLVSGCSPSVFAVATNPEMTPEGFMNSIINDYIEEAEGIIS